ncbi:glutathione S-transferase family protein [Povalibacter sp.]|uniref:glutathione S-transferase family protein n=1 Tax=Povalibacter sp. TaxID=1962978 RepID=UPI002F42AEB7
MSLTLYLHPLASFCHKALIALYENGTPFESCIVDLMDPAAAASFLDLWPVGKIPVLRDDRRNRTLPETTIIIEYLDRHYPGRQPLLPLDPDEQLNARLWDRFFDLYVSVPMQKIVVDRIRPAGRNDPAGVEEAAAILTTAYGMIDRQLADKPWATGDAFTVADCSAAPALFFAGIVQPFPQSHTHLIDYFERLVQRASFQRVLAAARPYFHMFPYQEAIPARFVETKA